MTHEAISALFAGVVGPLHLLSFSTLLGTELYQTFIITKVCFRVLPRPAFVRLQGRLFQIYFQGQMVLLLVAAATYPPYGPWSLVRNVKDLALLVGATAAGVANLLVYEPRTRHVMFEQTKKGKILKASTPE
jgi:hypothetical protein